MFCVFGMTPLTMMCSICWKLKGITFLFKFKGMEVVVQEGFLFQFCELGCGDHPQEDLAKFDYGLERTLEKFRISAMFWQHLGTYCLNMAI